MKRTISNVRLREIIRVFRDFAGSLFTLGKLKKEILAFSLSGDPDAREHRTLLNTHRGPRSTVTSISRPRSRRLVRLCKTAREICRHEGAKERKKTRHLCLVKARGGPSSVGPLGWSRGRPRRWGVLEVKQTCDYRLPTAGYIISAYQGNHLSPLSPSVSISLPLFFSLVSLRIHHPGFSAKSLSLSHSSCLRSFVLLEHRRSYPRPEKKRKRGEIEEAANRGQRLYSTPSSSVEDEGEGREGGGTGASGEEGRRLFE